MLASGGQEGNWARSPFNELDAAFGGAVSSDKESSEEEDDDDEALLYADVPATAPIDEKTAQAAQEREAKCARVIERLKKRKQRLKAKLAEYARKEVKFIAEMDSHMDEVERTEHALSLRIEQLTNENSQLRGKTEKRSRDNAELAEKLAESTTQCNESETRVQFLVDRIVALLSNGSANPEETQAIVEMRQRERDMLRSLEETRAQYDEVRQQNGELNTRLTEELQLSRRLADQLAEVEERFFHNRCEVMTPSAGAAADIAASLPPRAARLGPRPGGLRGDEVDVPPERVPGMPAVPTSVLREEKAIAEPLPLVKPSRPPSQLGVVHEGMPAEQLDLADGPVHSASLFDEPGVNADADADADGGACDGGAYDDAWGDGDEDVPAVGRLCHKLVSQAASSHAKLVLMEEKLKEALDHAVFERAVLRTEPGIYTFGSNVQVVVELTPDGEAIAARKGEPFQPIGDFVRYVASEGTSSASEQAAPPAEVPPASEEVPTGHSAPGGSAERLLQQHAQTQLAQQQVQQSQQTHVQPPGGRKVVGAGTAGQRMTSPRQPNSGSPGQRPPSSSASRPPPAAAARAGSPSGQQGHEPSVAASALNPGQAAGLAPVGGVLSSGRAALSQPMMANHLFSPRGPAAVPSAGVPVRLMHPPTSSAGPLVPQHGPTSAGAAAISSSSPLRMGIGQGQSVTGRQWPYS
eukprot:TRINITY_DN1966_c0_g1_i3.p1 TRINITY_DN1966_c0_g1~~TRINITY_DN1966_c0_g1_i3.p1  ORF type:complete len:695 (+),score=159.30 TRINITY_DN1966_c0_g1_i3:61-2145(+)